MARSALLNIMVTAALKAGRSLTKDFGEVENLQVSVKGPRNFVTAADRKAEEILHDELIKARPDYGFLGEEGGAREGADKTHTWIVDPLDGTTNFLHGVPHFSISIAVEEKKPGGGTEITHGLIYQPLTDESFWAEKGRGAWLQDARLRVSARRDLSECLIGTGIPHCGRGTPEGWAKIYGAVAPQVAGIRRFGSAALDLAWVAAGRMDGFWEDDLDLWDTAAGVLLVKEAGGFVTDYRGADRAFERGEYVIGSAAIHSKLQKLIAGALRA